MEFKIMVTGRMETIVRDVCNHLQRDRGYQVVSCIPSKRELFGAYLSELPQVLIICLRNENSQTVSVYDVLKDYEAEDAAKLVVIASHADRAVFVGHTGLTRITFMARPLSLSALYYKLHEYEEEWEEVGRRLVTESIEEYNGTTERIQMRRKHIMVIDDDPEMLSQIKENLREFYDVTLVSTGKHVIRYLSRYKVDLILLDYMMPDMDGLAVLQLLRGNPNFCDIPVMFLTGLAERDRVARIIQETKPEGFVLKPTKKSELVARIIEVLG